MTEADLAMKLLAQLRLVTNPTPAKLLAEFRRRAAEVVKVKATAQGTTAKPVQEGD
jgi:hypothetical protein